MMRVSLVLYSMYCRSPHDKDLYVNIFIENGLAESLTHQSDAFLIGIIYLNSKETQPF